MDQSQKLLMGVPDTGRYLSCGRSTVYELLNAGKLKSVKIGSRRLIPLASIEAYVASLTNGEG